jgi:hypothetical protein
MWLLTAAAGLRLLVRWLSEGGLRRQGTKFTMLTRWLTGEGGKHARDAEQGFPAVAVVTHGVVAALTFVFVLLAAITVSRR